MVNFLWISSVLAAVLPPSLPSHQTLPLGQSVRGVEVLQSRVYLLLEGSPETPSRIVEYQFKDKKIQPTGKTLSLSVNNSPPVNHPSGLTHHPRFGTWLGNSPKTESTLIQLHWSKLYHKGSLADAILRVVVDDVGKGGTSPEFVRHAGKVFLASADSGPKGNEVRLYDPTRLSRATRTSEPGVVVHRFPVGPWIRSLHFWESKGALILSQNPPGARKSQWTVLDLNASIQQNRAVEIEVIPLPYPQTLAATHLFENWIIAAFHGPSPVIRTGSLVRPSSE